MHLSLSFESHLPQQWGSLTMGWAEVAREEEVKPNPAHLPLPTQATSQTGSMFWSKTHPVQGWEREGEVSDHSVVSTMLSCTEKKKTCHSVVWHWKRRGYSNCDWSSHRVIRVVSACTQRHTRFHKTPQSCVSRQEHGLYNKNLCLVSQINLR